MRKLALLTTLVTSLTAAPLFAEEPQLPAGYEGWPMVIDQTCDQLDFKVYSGVSPKADLEIYTYSWGGELAAVIEIVYDGKQMTAGTSGLYQGEWLFVQSDDPMGDEHDRLIQSALLDVGGAQATEALFECETKATVGLITDMSEELGGVLNDFLKGINDALDGIGD